MVDNHCKNPCGEIVLGEPQPVMPWVQVQLMVAIGTIKPEEAPTALRTLQDLQEGQDT